MQAPQLASGPPTLVRPPCLPAPGTILGSLVSPHETAIEDIIRYDNACGKTRKCVQTQRHRHAPSFVRKTCHTGGPTLTVSFNFESIPQVVNWQPHSSRRGHRQARGKLSPHCIVYINLAQTPFNKTNTHGSQPIGDTRRSDGGGWCRIGR